MTTPPFQFVGFNPPLSGSRKIYRREIKYDKYTYKDAIILSPVTFHIFDITPPDLIVKIFNSNTFTGADTLYVIPLNLKFICDNVPYFESMLRTGNNFKEKTVDSQPAEVELKNFQPIVVQKYFKCIYENSVELTTDEAFDIYDLADYFQDTETRSQCVIHIRNTIEDKHLLRALEYTEFDQECKTIGLRGDITAQDLGQKRFSGVKNCIFRLFFNQSKVF